MKRIIHIGANKTGSTTLQKCLFSKCSELAYLGEYCKDYESKREALDSLVFDDDDHYMKTEVEEIFKEWLVNIGPRSAIYSNEDISRSRVPSQCARRLALLVQNAEIVLVVRNQITAIPSWYVNHGAFLKMVPRRYWRRFVSFEEWMSYCLEFMKYSPLDGFYYNRIIKLYEKYFDKSRIHILLYEDFLNSPQLFVNRLCKILGIEMENARKLLDGKWERKGRSQREVTFHKIQSSLFPNIKLPEHQFFKKASHVFREFLNSGIQARSPLNDKWKYVLISLYREENRMLAESYDLPLENYGYPI